MVGEPASDWIPARPPHHSERRVIGVVLIGLISFSVGIGVGYALNSYISALNKEQPTILVMGTVSSPRDNLCCYFPDYVNFVTQNYAGTLAYRVEVHLFQGFQNYTAEYSVYLPSDTTYYIYLGFLNYTAAKITECVPNPSYVVVSHSTAYPYHTTGGISWIEDFNFRC